MKLNAYSSLVAFLEHRKALAASAKPTADERSVLSEMEKLIDAAGADVRAALEHDSGRHRERAERKLRRELIARGVLSG